MDSNKSQQVSACPVDHASRSEFLKEAQRLRPVAHPSESIPLPSSNHASQTTTTSWSWKPYLNLWKTNEALKPPPSGKKGFSSSQHRQSQTSRPQLGTERVISSIPRTNTTSAAALSRPTPSSTSSCEAASAATPPNAETASPVTSTSGHWVYPSETQFMTAMQRKGHVAEAADMSIVVPIHNAVNERAWSEILEWEKPYPAPCGGPKLHSFSGDSKKLTPKAWLMTLIGYQRPFDRHDWIVDRCGTRVDYVIDFYSGKKASADRISFYLDVRPKLNSLEGIKMRVRKFLGIS